MQPIHFRTCIVLACAMAAGCATTEPTRPETALPAQFHTTLPASGAASVADAQWWRAMGDPELDQLVERALMGNLQLEAAGARIEAARAVLRQVRSATRPQVQYSDSTSRQRLSENGLFGNAIDAGAFPGTYTTHSIGIDASWEIDLFGANRAQRHGAEAWIDSVAAERDALSLSLPAEVARLYVEHLVVAQEVASLRRSIAAGEQAVMLHAERHQLGDLADTELTRARMQVDALRAGLPALEARREALRHAMGALLGTGEYIELPEQSPLLENAPRLLEAAVPAGTPSDLLQRRPDLRRAEARFRQAFAEHQYAVADQYPRFVLGGGVGLESLKAGDLLKSASLAWNLVRQFTVPLLDGGRRTAVRDQRQAEFDAAVAVYRDDVIQALVDVEQSLLARNAARNALAVNELRLVDAGAQLERERMRYALGDCAMTQVSEAEQLYEQVLAEVLDARGEALTSYVRLQKALGGPVQARL